MNVELPPTLIERLHFFASRCGNLPFLRLLKPKEAPIELTFDGLMYESVRWWRAYERIGIPEGGRIIVALPHSVDLYAAYVGAMLARCVPGMIAPPSPKLRGTEFESMARAQYSGLDVALSVVEPRLADRVAALSGRPVLTPAQVVFDAFPAAAVPPMPAGSGAPTLVQYSSGTTGHKKGVVISQAALLRQVDDYATAIRLEAGDSILSWLPLFHDMGLIACLMLPLLRGIPLTAMSPFDWIGQPASLLDAVTLYRPTLMWLPNFAYHVLAKAAARKDPGCWDLSSLRAVVNCSEPVRNTAHHRLMETLSGQGLRPDALKTCYAMAETTFAVTSGGFGGPIAQVDVDSNSLVEGRVVQSGATRLVSSGTPIAGTNLWIGDPERPQIDGQVGEIWVRGPSLASEYLGNTEATKEVFKDGRYRTSDLGFLVGGELFVIGRKDDVIVAAGKNLQPQDVEEVVAGVDGIAQGRVVAFGVESDEDGTAHLVVVAESERTGDAERDELRREVAAAILRTLDIVARDVRIVDSRWIRKSTSGKLARKENKAAYLSRFGPPAVQSSASLASGGDRLSIVRALVASVIGDSIANDSRLLSSGRLDSLALVQLLSGIEERFGIDVPSPALVGFGRFDSIEAIAALLDDIDSGFVVDAPGAETETRALKCRDYIEGRRDADLLILGSSTAFFFRHQVALELGYRSFNFAVSAGDALDHYCIARLVMDRAHVALRRIILAVDTFSIRLESDLEMDVRLSAQPELVVYLHDRERDWLEVNREGMARVHSHARLHQQRLGEWSPGFRYAFHPATGDVLDLDLPMEAQDRPRHTDAPLDRCVELEMIFNQFTKLSGRRIAYLSSLAEVAASRGIALDFVMMPLHPVAADYLSSRTSYKSWSERIAGLIGSMAGGRSRVFDFRSVDRFAGDPDDFSDAYHVGPVNSGRMMRMILDG